MRSVSFEATKSSQRFLNLALFLLTPFRPLNANSEGSQNSQLRPTSSSRTAWRAAIHVKLPERSIAPNPDYCRHWRGQLKAHPKSNRFSLTPKSHAQNRMDRQILPGRTSTRRAPVFSLIRRDRWFPTAFVKTSWSKPRSLKAKSITGLTASVINPRPQYFRASQNPRFSGVPGRQSSKQPMTSVGVSFKNNPQLHRLIPCGGRSTFSKIFTDTVPWIRPWHDCGQVPNHLIVYEMRFIGGNIVEREGFQNQSLSFETWN